MAYAVRALQLAFFGGRAEVTLAGPAPVAATQEPFPPISVPERIGAVILLATSLLVGLYPQVLLNMIEQSLQPPLFEGFSRGFMP